MVEWYKVQSITDSSPARLPLHNPPTPAYYAVDYVDSKTDDNVHMERQRILDDAYLQWEVDVIHSRDLRQGKCRRTTIT